MAYEISTAGDIYGLFTAKSKHISLTEMIDENHIALCINIFDRYYIGVLEINTSNWTAYKKTTDFENVTPVYGNYDDKVYPSNFFKISDTIYGLTYSPYDSSFSSAFFTFKLNTSTWEFSKTNAYGNYVLNQGSSFTDNVLVQGNRVIVSCVAFQYMGDPRFYRVFDVDTSTGEITAYDGEYLTSQSGTYLNRLNVLDDNHFISLYLEGATPTDNYAQVVEVDVSAGATTVSTAGTAYNYNVESLYDDVMVIDSNHFIIFYSQNGTSGATMQVFEVDTSDWSISTASSKISMTEPKQLYTNWNFRAYMANENTIVASFIDSDGGLFFNTYYLNTANWEISTETISDTLVLYTSNVMASGFQKIDTNHYLFVANIDEGDDNYVTYNGVLKLENLNTYEITTTASFEIDATGAAGYSLAEIDATHYLATWTNGSLEGEMQVVEVNTTTWEVTTSGAIRTFTTVNNHNDIANVTSNVFVNFFQGVDADGFVNTYSVNTSTWAITIEGTALEFDTANCVYNSCLIIDTNHYLNVWGSGTDKKAQVFEVDTTSYAVTTSNTALTFATDGTADWVDVVEIDTNHFLTISLDTSNGLVAHTLELNTSTWAVTTAGSSFVIDSSIGTCGAPIVSIDENHILILFESTSATTVSAQVLEVNTDTWAITTKSALFEIDAADYEGIALESVDRNHFLALLTPNTSGITGKAVTLQVDTGTWAISTTAATLSGGEWNGANKDNDLLRITEEGEFLAFYRDGDLDSRLEVIQVPDALNGDDYNQALTNSVLVSSTLDTAITFGQLLTESVVAGVAYAWNGAKSLTESVITSQTFNRVATVYKSFAEAVKLNEVFAKLTTFVGILTESVVVGVNIVKDTVITITQHVVAGVSRVSVLGKGFTEAIKIGETYADKLVDIILLTEHVKLGESITKKVLKTFSATVSVGVVIRKLLNGLLNTGWTKIPRQDDDDWDNT